MAEFWQYSSRTRAGQNDHPTTAARRELVLEMWAAGFIAAEIVEVVGLEPRTVAYTLARARRKGDARAIVRHAATLRRMCSAG